MKKIAIALLSFILCTSAQAITVGGVEVPNKVNVENHSLTLNGSGIRSKFFIDLYVGSLYTKAPAKTAEAVIDSKNPLAIRLNITSSLITAKNLSEAITEGFNKATNNDLKPYQKRLDQFMDAIGEKVNKGDQFTLFFVPGVGVNVWKNHQELTKIKGDDFKKTLIKVWLGNQPADESLKKAMLKALQNGS